MNALLSTLTREQRRAVTALVLMLLAAISFSELFGTNAAAAPCTGQESQTKNEQRVWLIVTDDGRQLEFVGRYGYRMDGGGKVNFKRGGRVVELPAGLTILVDEKPVNAKRQVSEGESVRITDGDGKTLWKLAPLPRPE